MNWKKHILNILFPNRCPVCNAVLLPDELLCEECAEKILLDFESFCHVCGKIRCICKERKLFYDKAVICSAYTEEAIPAIIHLKESNNTNFAVFSGQIMAERIRNSFTYDGKYDCIMPVPMHPSKQRKRGYNQSALIAKEMAKVLEIPYREDVLYKNLSRYAQHQLNAEERQLNVFSFGIHDISVKGLNILLCDDVLTTGSTLNRCAELLKSKGAVSVTVASATTTPPKNWKKITA
ncbi:MAG: ComF family protein [Oscillospiraceae bacterium]